VSSVQHKTSDLPKCNLKNLLPSRHEFRTFRCITQLTVTYRTGQWHKLQSTVHAKMEHETFRLAAIVLLFTAQLYLCSPRRYTSEWM